MRLVGEFAGLRDFGLRVLGARFGNEGHRGFGFWGLWFRVSGFKVYERRAFLEILVPFFKA